jgi:DNA-binding MarR family transcriptional regulator
MIMTSPSGGSPSLTIGQAVGQAEASLTRLLTGVLAERRISRPTYLALQRLNTLGGHATRDDYERDLREWLGLDGPGAKDLAGQLEAAGLTAAGNDTIRLTEPGRALRERILAEGAKITGPLLATLDAGDVEITIRTLREITTRARGIPVRRTTTEESS